MIIIPKLKPYSIISSKNLALSLQSINEISKSSVYAYYFIPIFLLKYNTHLFIYSLSTSIYYNYSIILMLVSSNYSNMLLLSLLS